MNIIQRLKRAAWISFETCVDAIMERGFLVNVLSFVWAKNRRSSLLFSIPFPSEIVRQSSKTAFMSRLCVFAIVTRVALEGDGGRVATARGAFR